MPRPHVRDETKELGEHFARIRRELQVPEAFPPDVLAAAADASDRADAERADRRDLAFVTLDPVGSRDLDQAFHLERRGDGHRFHYAIADVAAWVTPGGPVDLESWRRGTTVYCPDTRVPLHPTALSEGAASLLPDADRSAVLWHVDLDERGAVTDVAVERAVVRSRQALDYASAQAAFDAGRAHPQIELLAEVGRRRQAREAERGGVSLVLPEQRIEHDDGAYVLRYGTTLDTERWNAQLSLCCGMVAADLTLDGGTGILRTLPSPTPEALDALRAAARSLDVAWPDGQRYPDWIRGLDPNAPTSAALMVAASRTLRGAGYAPFTSRPAEPPLHGAIAAPYAHVTAPLRRLVDRFGTECALAAHAGRRPPGWAVEALGRLGDTMAATASRAGAVDRACVDVVEAALLRHRIGERIDGVVTQTREPGLGMVQLVDPAVIAPVRLTGGAGAGEQVEVLVVAADVAARRVELEVVAVRR